MSTHARLARVVREVLLENFGDYDDQADAIAAAVMTEQREHIAPLADRMREAADTIEELNALSGLGLYCAVSPTYLRKEACRMDGWTA